jgi:tetratricopeptide (TPR) repeat protein
VRLAVRAVLLALVVAAAPAAGQDQPAADPLAPARKAYDAMCAARKAEEQAIRKSEHEAKVQAARAAFFAAFQKVPWNEWDLKYDADLLAEGVMMTAGSAMRDEDWPGVRRAAEFLAEELPENRQTAYALRYLLPFAYSAAGEWDAGTERLTRYAAKLAPADAAYVQVQIGDLRAAAGDFEGARKTYRQAEATFATRKPATDGYPLTFEGKIKDRGIVGTTAPDLPVLEWVGGKGAWLAGPTDRVVLLYVINPRAAAFKAEALKEMGALQKQLGPQALSAFAATSWFRVSPLTMVEDPVKVKMPRNPGDSEGEEINVGRDGFRKYLEAYRTRVRCTVPFAVVANEPLAKYTQSPMHELLLLIAPDGKVVQVFEQLEWRQAKAVTAVVCARIARERAAAQGPK